MQGLVRIERITQHLQQRKGEPEERPPLARRQYPARRPQRQQTDVLPRFVDVLEPVLRKELADPPSRSALAQ